MLFISTHRSLFHQLFGLKTTKLLHLNIPYIVGIPAFGGHKYQVAKQKLNIVNIIHLLVPHKRIHFCSHWPRFCLNSFRTDGRFS